LRHPTRKRPPSLPSGSRPRRAAPVSEQEAQVGLVCISVAVEVVTVVDAPGGEQDAQIGLIRVTVAVEVTGARRSKTDVENRGTLY